MTSKLQGRKLIWHIIVYFRQQFIGKIETKSNFPTVKMSIS